MRRLTCPTCAAAVFFDDLACVVCGTELAFDVDGRRDGRRGDGDRLREPRAARVQLGGGGRIRDLVPVVPARRVPGRGKGSLEHRSFQQAKRRVVRQLHRFGVDPAAADPPLRFELDRSEGEHRVTIGHADGLVTLDVAEADPVVREEARAALGEPYRTPLGHVRHETGHWHWAAVVASDDERLARFRERFGDERVDYARALEAHYEKAGRRGVDGRTHLPLRVGPSLGGLRRVLRAGAPPVRHARDGPGVRAER